MHKAQRLLALMDLLRRQRRPASAETLAGCLNVSPRTVYRDIADLCAQGADIRGEAGLGFVLKQDFGLPPLMFDEAEIEALVFGMRWAVAHTDGETAQNARSVLAKIRAVLPEKLRESVDTQSFYPLPSCACPAAEHDALGLIRTAMRGSRMLSFDYTDLQNRRSRRTVVPLAVGWFDDSRVLAAWCLLRGDFRHFRADRMENAALDAPSAMPRTLLLRQWQQREKIDLSAFEI
ncbi:HTH domain [Kingella potus]|uniref:HTH domain n=1 Tax=Kingella potus TaxID=265175 RepID=A0A377QYV9_9NEIS|nr:YafY family protein [Kingella potus]UOP01645.1 YafY family transcriptional regulator [Kingella potus]STR00059.1 HTH domain [Kingella potus]